jgi:hypothetical protein
MMLACCQIGQCVTDKALQFDAFRCDWFLLANGASGKPSTSFLKQHNQLKNKACGNSCPTYQWSAGGPTRAGLRAS